MLSSIKKKKLLLNVEYINKIIFQISDIFFFFFIPYCPNRLLIIDISHRNEILHSSEDNGEFLATNSHRYPFNHANTLAVVQGRSPLRKNEIQSSRTHRIFHSRFTSVCEVKLHRRGEGSGSLLSTCIMKSFVNQCQRTKFRPFVIYQKRQSAKVSFPPRSETLSLRVASRLSRHV